MARLTISLPHYLAGAASDHAASQKRSASAYVAGLIENDLRAAGLLTRDVPADNSELVGKIGAVLAARPAARTELEEFVRKHARAARRVSARPLTP